MAEAQTYGRVEIERYLQRKMSPQEMHDFEKALMNDPFLADALEGYTSANEEITAAHLRTIESTITTGKQEAKVVKLPATQKNWWQVAAIILVIASAGLLIFFQPGTNSDVVKPPLASAPAAEIIQQQDTVRPIQSPIAGADVLPAQKLFNNKKSSPPFVETESKPAPPAEVSRQDMPTPDTAAGTTYYPSATAANDLVVIGYSSARKSASKSEVVSGKVEGVQEVTSKEFKGKVIDALGEPMPFASVRAKNRSVATVSDSKGNFTLSSRDSVLNIDVSAAGYLKKDVKLKDDSTLNKVVLEEEKMSLSEVVVTDLARQRRSSAPAANNAVVSNQAEPEGGWKNFEQYVRKQVDSLKIGVKNNTLNKQVTVEFSVNKKGRPVNITVPKEVNKIAAEKAKQILSNGPRWKNSQTNKRVIVVIPF